MASIETAKKIIEAGRDSDVSVWLWGPHGIGKSESVEQVAKKLGIGFIEVRAALTEAGDWMGLPLESKDEHGNTVAQFAMSSFLPQDPNWEGILFLDELNRARPDIINCVFQLVLNRKIMNHYNLPKGVSIVAAGNPGDADYDVTSIDPALLGRFCHIDLSPTQSEWIEFSKESGVRKDVVQFIQSVPKMLDPKIKGFDFDQVQPNRRGWTLLAKMMDSLDKLNFTASCITDVATGLVGTAAAVQYAEFRRSNYLRIDVSKILPEYKTVQKSVQKIVKEGKLPEQKQALEELFELEGFSEQAIYDNDTYTVNLLTFLTDLSEDVAYVGADLLMNKCKKLTDKILTWVSDTNHENHKVAKKFYDVVMTLNQVETKKK